MSPTGISVLATLALSAPAVAPTDLSGGWTLKGDFAGGPRYTLVCVLQGAGDAASGPCTGATGRNLPTSGRLDGGRMSFGYLTDYNGSGVHLDFSGAVDSLNQVKGVVAAGSAKGVFAGSELLTSGPGRSAVWKFSVAFPGLNYVVLCSFKAAGARIGGPCNVIDGTELQTQASISGADVKFAYDTVVGGRPVHVDYTGALSGDGSVAGAVKAGDATGTFTAARR